MNNWSYHFIIIYKTSRTLFCSVTFLLILILPWVLSRRKQPNLPQDDLYIKFTASLIFFDMSLLERLVLATCGNAESAKHVRCK